MLKFAVVVAAALALLAASRGAAEQPAVVRMSMLVPAQRIERLLRLVWADCGTPETWVKIHSVSVQPDPVRLSGMIKVSFSFSAAHSFGDSQPLEGSILMKKNVLGAWITLPCINNVGSCNYANLCISPPPPSTCPAEFVKAGVPCRCPFPAGNFSLPGYSFAVDASKIPKFLVDGDYEIAVIVSAGDNQVMCVMFELSLD